MIKARSLIDEVPEHLRSAMPMGRAIRLCPGLRVVPGQHGLYGEVSEEVMARLRDLAPLVEQISIDEAFIDTTGTEKLWGESAAAAKRISGAITKTNPSMRGISISEAIRRNFDEIASPCIS